MPEPLLDDPLTPCPAAAFCPVPEVAVPPTFPVPAAGDPEPPVMPVALDGEPLRMGVDAPEPPGGAWFGAAAPVPVDLTSLEGAGVPLRGPPALAPEGGAAPPVPVAP